MSRRVISAILTLQDRDFSSNLRRASDRSDDFGRGVTRVGNQVQRFGQSATRTFKAVGAGAAALGAAGLAALAVGVSGAVVEMDSAFSRLEARTGAVGHELEEYKAIAQDVFVSGFGESITQAADNVSTFASMFKDIDYGELADLTKGASTIAETWDYEAKEVGRSIQSMTQNFDGLGEAKALDLMTHAFQKTGDYSDDLLDTFSEYSMHFSKMGLSAEEFTGILIKGAEGGAWNLDKVGDSIKEFGIRAIDGSKTTAEGFAAIGLNADEMADKFIQGGDKANNAFAATLAGLSAMKDPVAQNAAGVSLFGTQWEDVREDVILSMADSASAVEGFEGSTARAADALHNNFKSKMIKSWRDLQVGIADVVNGAGAQDFLDGISDSAAELVPKIQGVVTKAFEFGNTIRDNWGPIKETAIGVGTAVGVLAVGMGTLKVITTVTTMVRGFRTAMGLATAGQWAMNTAMLASPLTWVVVGIAAVVAAGVLLYRNWDTVRAGWDTAWNGIKSAAGAGVNFVIDQINGLIEVINKIPGVNIPIVAKVDWGQATGPANGADFRKLEGSYDVGTNRIARDHAAMVHKDEMIIPARQAERVRAAGGNIDNIDKMIQPSTSPTASTVTSSPNVSSQSPTGGVQVIIQNFNAKGVTAKEIIEEFIPLLKLRLANL